MITYWRSIEDSLEFAAGSAHREVMTWWRVNAEDLKHIGISHEIYQADPSAYENVFHNLQPMGIGATSYIRKGEKLVGGMVPDQWINPLVDARRGRLRTPRGRLGWWNNSTKMTIDEVKSAGG